MQYWSGNAHKNLQLREAIEASRPDLCPADVWVEEAQDGRACWLEIRVGVRGRGEWSSVITYEAVLDRGGGGLAGLWLAEVLYCLLIVAPRPAPKAFRVLRRGPRWRRH